jgi:uncharacterized NAD(P)/FAD-binding protein YdhS
MKETPIGAKQFRIAVVGAGASGALAVAHLLRFPGDLRIVLIEPRVDVGRGLAYSTANPHHLLNVRAQNMSAFVDDPDHFWRWLQAQGHASEDRFCFLPRALYGRYLGSLVEAQLDAPNDARRLSLLRDVAVGIDESETGVRLALASGGSVEADVVILACGHEGSSKTDPLFLSPWAFPLAPTPPADSTVLILGTGLTMVDVALSLRDSGHHGRIVAVSRRGLTPQAHRRAESIDIDWAARPSGASLAKLSRWLRALVREQRRQGGDWRSVIDAFRPYVQQVWREMPTATRRRFLEHARPWWDIHRHRMAPEVEARLREMVEAGALEIIAGKMVALERTDEGARVSIRPRGAASVSTLDVTRVVSCRGLVNDPRKSDNPLIAKLLADGLARVDALGVGFDVAEDCAVIDASGRRSDRLFAMGPMSQAAFWEITAVPDIRLQAAELALRLKQGRLDQSGTVQSDRLTA